MNATPLSEEVTLLLVNVLFQATAISGVALILSRLFRHHPVVRQWILTPAMICMLTSPVVTAVMQTIGVSLVTLPVSWEASEKRATVVAATDRLDVVVHPLAQPESLRLRLSEEPFDELPESVVAPATVGEPPTRKLLSVILLLGQSLWGIGVLVCFVGIARSSWKLRFLRRRVTSADDAFANVCESVQQLLGTQQLPRFACSAHVNTPITTGIFRPLVILPFGLCQHLRPNELRAVLMHEIAHALRRDQLVLLLQQILAAIFWPHPLIHVLNRQLARAREEVCDNHVLGIVKRKCYAETLLRVGLVISQPTLMAAPGFFSADWTLEERIRGILDPRRNVMTQVHFRTAVAIMALFFLVAVIAAGNRLSAQPENQSNRAGQNREQAVNNAEEKPSNPKAFHMPPKALRISVWLKDGSRLVGHPQQGSSLPFAVDEKPGLSVESSWMVFRNSYVYRNVDDSFTVDFYTGERKSGSAAEGAVKLSTALGDVDVPVGQVQQIVVDRMSPIHEQLYEGYHWLLGDVSDLALEDVGAKAIVEDNLGDSKWHWRIEQPAGYVTFYEFPYVIDDLRIWGSRSAYWPLTPLRVARGSFVSAPAEFTRALSGFARVDQREQPKRRDRPDLFVYGSRYVLTSPHSPGRPPKILGSIHEKELRLKYDGRFQVGRGGSVGAIFVLK